MTDTIGSNEFPAADPEKEEGNNPVPADPKTLKALKIKYGVVKRLTKDKQSYQKEAEQQKAKLEQFKAEGKDESFLRNAVNCVKETELMIPDVHRRLEQAYGELKEMVDTERDTPVGRTPEFAEALRILKEVKSQ